MADTPLTSADAAGPPSADAGPAALLDYARSLRPGTLMERLQITFTEVGSERVVATMPVDGNTQPFGSLHGGATAALIESVASLGATVAAGAGAAGVDISVHHLRPARIGGVRAVGAPLHAGSRIAVWQVDVFDEVDVLIATGRCTLSLRA